MSERLINQEPYYAMTLPLLRAIPLGSRTAGFDYLKTLILPLNWEATRRFESGDKFTALNKRDGFFAKLFSPRNRQYAEATWDALRQLGQCPLSIPVLSPVSFCQEAGISGLIFPLGRVVRNGKFGEIYPEADWQQINEVVQAHGLEPLSSARFVGDKIEIVELDGKEYAVDPIEDSDYSIAVIYPRCAT